MFRNFKDDTNNVGWIKDESTNNISRTKVDSLRLIHPTLKSKKKPLGFCLSEAPVCVYRTGR